MPLKAFQLLPIEVNENIAFYIDTDKDFANFNAICRQTHDAIQSHRCSAWRARWEQKYDFAPGRNGQVLKADYMRRRMYLYTKAFKKGFGAAERNCIEILKQLIIESFSEPSGRYSKNIFQLKRFISKSNILETLNACLEPKARVTHDLQVLLICLAHWNLSSVQRATRGSTTHFPLSQILVYRKFRNIPLLKNNGALTGSIINTKLLLAMIYFWRFHKILCHHRASSQAWGDFENGVKPNAWKRSVLSKGEEVKPLSRKWKGIHAYCPSPEELEGLFDNEADLDLGKLRTEELHFLDEFDHQGVQEIELDFSLENNLAPWPEMFEEHLQAMPSESLCAEIRKVFRTNNNPKENRKGKVANLNRLNKNAGDSTQGFSRSPSLGPIRTSVVAERGPLTDMLNTHNSMQTAPTFSHNNTSPERGTDFLPFSGSVNRSDLGSIRGILHDLPSQSGFPGFQRVSFMRYNNLAAPGPGDTASLSALSALSEEDYECQEGVVLPGGHMIIGRWWFQWYNEEPQESGPFIMWEADE